MNKPFLHNSFLSLLRSPQGEAGTVLLFSPLLIITWYYFGSREFFWQHRPEWSAAAGDPAAAACTYMFLAAFVLLGLIPFLVVRFVLRRPPADYGVSFGNRRRTCRSFLLLAPVMILIAWLSAHDHTIQAYYPLNRRAGETSAGFAFHAAMYVLYYLGWEFHFRGFLQHGLRRTMGDWPAMLVQTLASTLAHLGRPAVETYAAVIAGVFWGFLAFRTRSLLSGLLQHALLGVTVDYFLCRRW